ncbi:MAG: hypothetical protein WCY05_08000 [Candidatus Omnitrophota bacterium]
MKKLMVILLCMLIAPVALLAQTDFPIPTDIADVFVNFGVWIGSFTGIAGLTVFLTATVLAIFKVTGSGLRQLISWAMGSLLVVLMNVLHIGFAADLIWYGVIAYAVAVSLAANRMFDIGLLKSLLEAFKLTKPTV